MDDTSKSDLSEALISTTEFEATLKEEARRMGEFAGQLKGEELRPLLVLLLDRKAPDGERERALVALPEFPEGEGKRKVLFAAGMEVAGRKLPVVAAFLAAEAWTKMMTEAEGWRAKLHGPPRPSTAPDRTEALVLWGRTVDGRAALAMAPLSHHSSATKLGAWRFIGPGADVQDNLLGFFFSGLLLKWKEMRGEGTTREA